MCTDQKPDRSHTLQRLRAWRCALRCSAWLEAHPDLLTTTCPPPAEPYAKRRDAAVRQLAEAAGIAVHSPVSHTLYDPSLLLAKAPGGRAPLTMQAGGGVQEVALASSSTDACARCYTAHLPMGEHLTPTSTQSFVKFVELVGDPPAPASPLTLPLHLPPHRASSSW